jgi:hypothetical protein
MLLAVALMAGAVSAEADQKLSRMTALYDEICLKTFPDDKAVEAIMVSRKARPLTAEEVKITMRDDPAKGWELQDGSATVWLEFPPFHACSVRWNAPEIGDLSNYQAVAQRYEAQKGGFSPIEPFDGDQGDIHVHAVGEQRTSPDGRAESLFIFEQHLTDSKRRAAGETGHVLRFVHQFAPPPPPPSPSLSTL